MKNDYLPDAEWHEKRDHLAGIWLLREAEALLANTADDGDLDDWAKQIIDAARQRAGLQMGRIRLMPASCRELDEAA